MKIELLDPNAIENLGLVNRQKIQLRQRCVLIQLYFLLNRQKNLHVH